MLRAILLIVALAIVVVIGLTATGIVSLNKTQSAQAPKFQVEVKKVDVGTTTANVQVPTVGTTTRQVEVPSLTVGGNAQGNAQ